MLKNSVKEPFMTPERERNIQDRCICFKRILSENRLYTIVQCLLDILLITTVGTAFIVGRSMLPMLLIAFIIAKLIVLFLLKGTKANTAGLIMTMLYFPLMAAVKMPDGETCGITVLIMASHIFRLVSCTAASRIKGLYGAPGFNGFLLANELKKDEKLAGTVLGSYNDVSNEMTVRTALTEVSLPKLIRLLKPVGIITLAVGIGMTVSAHKISSSIKNAETLPVSEKTANKTLALTTDDIYWQNTTGDICSYWCRIDGQCVNVVIYDQDPQHEFEKLCFACRANSESAAMELVGAEHETNSSPIKFVAKVKKYKADDPLRPSKKSKEHIDDSVETVEDQYLEVIDRDSIGRHRNAGILIITIGAVMTAAFYIMYYVSRNNVGML